MLLSLKKTATLAGGVGAEGGHRPCLCSSAWGGVSQGAFHGSQVLGEA